MLEGVFESAFDLHGYLERIGFTGRATADLDTLREVTRLHPAAIPFENLDPYLRRPVALDSAAVQRKLIHGGRGGWCFEHNLLLGAALAAIGFRPVGLGARVLWNAPPGVIGPRSHMVLLLDHDGSRYIVDAGFGGLTLTAPLEFEPDVAQPTPHERFRLRHLDCDFVMEAELGDSWHPLYRFDLQPQRLADYEVSNWYLCNFPQSHFLGGIIAARTAPGRRYALRIAELTTHTVGGGSERRILTSGDEIRAALRDTFGIAVPEGPDVDAAFARLLEPAR